MFDFFINAFNTIIEYFQAGFEFIRGLIVGLGDLIESLFSGLTWLRSLALYFPSFQIITTAVFLAFGLTIALKLIGR